MAELFFSEGEVSSKKRLFFFAKDSVLLNSIYMYIYLHILHIKFFREDMI